METVENFKKRHRVIVSRMNILLKSLAFCGKHQSWKYST